MILLQVVEVGAGPAGGIQIGESFDPGAGVGAGPGLLKNIGGGASVEVGAGAGLLATADPGVDQVHAGLNLNPLLLPSD